MDELTSYFETYDWHECYWDYFGHDHPAFAGKSDAPITPEPQPPSTDVNSVELREIFHTFPKSRKSTSLKMAQWPILSAAKPAVKAANRFSLLQQVSQKDRKLAVQTSKQVGNSNKKTVQQIKAGNGTLSKQKISEETAKQKKEWKPVQRQSEPSSLVQGKPDSS